MKKKLALIIVVVVSLLSDISFGACPSADVTDDCKVNLKDLAEIASEWLTTYNTGDLTSIASQWLDEGVPDQDSIELIIIPAGTFEMGDHHDGMWDAPTHTVTLSTFQMSKHEITNGQYVEYLNAALTSGDIKVAYGRISGNSGPYNNETYYDMNSSYALISRPGSTFIVTDKNGRNMDNDPVVVVSWYGAKAFCDYYGYSLPTEAQWEYAARGGQYSPYYRFPWGDTIAHNQANYRSYWSGGAPYYSYDVSPTSGDHPNWNDASPYTSPVATFSSNGYGLYDMSGNAWEWCSDWYDSGYYYVSPSNDPPGPINGSSYVLRGGSWGHYAHYCRVACRFDYLRAHRLTGFRVCR